MGPAMSRALAHPALRPLTEPAVYTPPALLAVFLVIVWALTGAGYFWPMWPVFGILYASGLYVSVRFGMSHPRGKRWLATQASLSLTVSVALTLIWAMSGDSTFWPVWVILSLAGLLALPWLRKGSRDRSLEVRVDELTRTRSGVLDVQASELRRIERDLHDGAQARLVALSMQLGRAEERLADSPETAALVRRAREEAAAAIGELRDLARGIAPPVLADRGLAAAVQSLADRAGSAVTVNAEIPRRPPPVVETAAYFVVAEALTNAAKHAPEAAVRITLWAERGELGIVVADDGLGGADPLGGGLTGLRQRVEALDGWLEVKSPVGEGTTVRASLPCES
jgi:signal transduction histidine kinase